MESSSQKNLSLIVLFVSLLLSQPVAIVAQTFDLKVEAAIVLYDRAATRTTRQSFIGVDRVYVAKVSKVLQGHEGSNFILILTGRQFAKRDLNINTKLHFNLTRFGLCDDTVENRLYFPDSARDETSTTRLLFSKGVKREDVPMDKTLPCYLFRGNDFPNEWLKKKN